MNTEKIPVLYEKGRPQAVFTKAFNVVTVAEVNAESYLEFDIYFTDRKRNYITNQAEIRIDGKAYKIKTVTDNKEHSSAKRPMCMQKNCIMTWQGLQDLKVRCLIRQKQLLP